MDPSGGTDGKDKHNTNATDSHTMSVEDAEVRQQFLGMSTVTRNSRNRTSVALINDVDDALDKPNSLAWFYDEDSGRVHVVPASEVGDE